MTPSLHRIPGAGVFDPFSLAAYATWAGVALGCGAQLLGGAPLDGPTQAGAVGMVGTLLLFVLRAWLDDRQAPLPLRQLTVSGQLLCALVATWGLMQTLHYEYAPALLVVVSTQLPVVFSRATVALLLVLANAALALTLLPFSGGLFHALLKMLAWIGFQAFGVIGCTFAVRLQEMGLAALRVNGELIATRRLLEEGTRAEERLRLARELHDVAGHKLTALKMQLRLQRASADASGAAVLEESARLADELLSDLRGVVSTLRVHEGVDLPRALRALDPGLPRPRVVFELDPGLRVSDMRSADTLLRCAQEALTNALRHSAAATVWLQLGVEGRELLLSVSDDGRGRAEALRSGNGLRGMRERLAELGGRLELRNRQPCGLTVRVLLPAALEGAPAPVAARSAAC